MSLYPIVLLTGPRQSGKSTLLQYVFADYQYVSLEDLDERAFANAKYYWDTQHVNIDCQANIVCLCPTCHRQIHYGNDSVKRELIEKLFNETQEKRKSVNLNLTLVELLKLYLIENV